MLTASDVNVDRHLVRYGKPPKLNQRHDSDAVCILWSREVPDHSSKIYIPHPFEGVFVLCHAKNKLFQVGWKSLRFFSLNKYIFQIFQTSLSARSLMSSEFDGPVVWESPSPKSNPMNLNLGTVGIVCHLARNTELCSLDCNLLDVDFNLSRNLSKRSRRQRTFFGPFMVLISEAEIIDNLYLPWSMKARKTSDAMETGCVPTRRWNSLFFFTCFQGMGIP